MIESKEYSYEEFPESEEYTENMNVIQTSKESRFLYYCNNVTYVTRDNLDLHLQIILPSYRDERSITYPCVVYVQGSAWMEQDVYCNVPQLAKFAARGYVTAIVEYRPSTLAPFPAQLQDAKTAVRYLRKNAEKYHIDSNNIFVWGDSSGGHTALLTGITNGNSELDTKDYTNISAAVNAVVDYYGPTDITKMSEAPSMLEHFSKNSPEGILIGGVNVLENKEKAQKTNPINYISNDKEIPPILIMHGSKDRIVPFQQSVLLFKALKEHNKNSAFYQLKGADHGGPQFWTDEVLDIVEKFIKQFMK